MGLALIAGALTGLGLGCGARTGLLVPDAGPDADATTDAIGDTGFDAGDSGFDTLTDIGLPDAPLPPPTLTFDVPFMEPPTPPRGTIATGLATIKQIDVAVVMDTTGSMSGSIENLRKNFKGSVLPGIAKAIPSVGFAVVDHKDYPIDPHGTVGEDFPVLVRQTITPDVGAAQAALDKLVPSGGSDGPESQIPAMFHTLTGAELRWSGGSVPVHLPAPGTVGGVDFRPGSLRIVVLVTDVEWHDCDYGAGVFKPPCSGDLVKAFLANNARFVDVTATWAPETQADSLSDQTGSSIPPSAFGTTCGGACCTGVAGAGRPTTTAGRCRLNFLHDGGNGVSDSIVRAITALAVGSTFDVIAQVVDDPSDGVDATKFVKRVRAMDEGDSAAGCGAHAAKDTDGDGVKDTFLGVPVGTRVCFEVVPTTNTIVKPTSEDQYFLAGLQILGLPGFVRLDTQTLRFRVPKLGTDAGVGVDASAGD